MQHSAAASGYFGRTATAVPRKKQFAGGGQRVNLASAKNTDRCEHFRSETWQCSQLRKVEESAYPRQMAGEGTELAIPKRNQR
jgi:hypothetical protein